MGLPEHFSEGADAHIRAERELRYVAVAPIVLNASAWCDIGRESSSLAARLVPDGYEGQLWLVDESRHSLEEARRRLGQRRNETIALDVSASEPMLDVDELLATHAPGGAAVVTCFELVAEPEWFDTISPWLCALHAEHDCTVVIGVPNLPPPRATTGDRPPLWGDAAIAELRQLFDGDAVVARQLPLSGSQLVLETTGELNGDLRVSVRPDGQPIHTLLAWGQDAPLLTEAGSIAPADLVSQRMVELARDAELEYLRFAMDSTGSTAQPRR